MTVAAGHHDDVPVGACADAWGLSLREAEVLHLVGVGMTNAEIAYVLGVSERTVQSHVASALSKSATRSRTQLAACAIRRGILASQCALCGRALTGPCATPYE